MKETLAEVYLRIRSILCEFSFVLRFHYRCPYLFGIILPALVFLVKD
ncbi:DUF7146 domain-containing protein [Bartonella senegalensis]